jgi:hypothetical protein
MEAQAQTAGMASALYGALPTRDLGSLAIQGNGEAFALFKARTFPSVAALSRRVIGPTGDFESVAAEAFAELWRQRERVIHADRVEEWLARFFAAGGRRQAPIAKTPWQVSAATNRSRMNSAGCCGKLSPTFLHATVNQSRPA